MKSAVIIPNSGKDKDLQVTFDVFKKLISIGFQVYIENDLAYKFSGSIGYSLFPEDADVIIVVGGDGTVLDASGYAIKYDIPLLCVNLGKVGYLSEIEPDMLDLLDRLMTGDFTVSEKMLLEIASVNLIDEAHKYAVNDIVISHESYLGIANLKLVDSVGNSIKYRADGVILATPQGSTAYSLSAGGPIVAHDVGGIIATPICAHSFFDRSVIFNAFETITVTSISDDALNISVDGRYVSALSSDSSCIIKCADKKLKMISFSRNSMFSNLFKKMKMLEDTE